MKEAFLKTYSMVPLGLRNDIIYVDEHYGAITWRVLWLEVNSDTDIAKRALLFLKKAEII